MRTLPDFLRPGLDVVFVGINPGTRSASTGHHYAGPGNHFWPLLYETGFVGERLSYEQDARVLEWNIGLTNMVGRASPSISDLSPAELRAGVAPLRRKLLKYGPRIVCFNSKRIYEVFCGHAVSFGLQAEQIGRSMVFVMPSTSARTASYQRADKASYFRDLRRILTSTAVEVAS